MLYCSTFLTRATTLVALVRVGLQFVVQWKKYNNFGTFCGGKDRKTDGQKLGKQLGQSFENSLEKNYAGNQSLMYLSFNAFLIVLELPNLLYSAQGQMFYANYNKEPPAPQHQQGYVI